MLLDWGCLSGYANLPAHPKAVLDPDRYFVFVVFSGAWDPLLALDPRDPLFLPMMFPETQIQTGYDILNIGSDPRIATPEMTFHPYIGI